MTKRSPFAKALDAAEKRLEKAKKERLEGQSKLALLDREIPELERIILTLRQRLVPPQLVHTSEVAVYRVEDDKTFTPIPGGIDNGVPKAPLPPELAKFALPQDLTGMGSVPNVKGPEVAELSEEDLLRDDL
jgi:hypothetical protein